MTKQFHAEPTEFGPKISYGDGKEWARVVLDSIGPHGVRVVTVEARYWRMIHSEIMTHRAMAKNAASSRAIPFRKFAEAINTDPFVPEFMGVEQKGMQAGDELDDTARAKASAVIRNLWIEALVAVEKLNQLGLHKSIINRYLEPWSYTTTLITATEWANFFRLRIHPKAERHFDKVARLIREAIRRSEPRVLQVGEWHTPYIREQERKVLELGRPGIGTDAHDAGAILGLSPAYIAGRDVQNLLCRASAGRCARLSYLTHDGKRDFGADIELCRKLIDPKHDDGSDDETIHSSPLEHVLRCEADPLHRSGPMVGWHQFRKDFPRENVAGIGPLE